MFRLEYDQLPHFLNFNLLYGIYFVNKIITFLDDTLSHVVGKRTQRYV